MAYVTPITFVALSTLTAAQLNSIQTNISALWPYTAAGDISYASAANTLARLAKGTAGQVLKMNTGATEPVWTQQLIEEHIVTAATEASITFSSIPSTFRHLKLIVFARGNYASTEITLRITLNGDTGNNYDRREVVSVSGSSTCNTEEANGEANLRCGFIPANNASAGLAGITEISLLYYKNTSWQKIIYALNGEKSANGTPSTSMTTRTMFGYWRSANAISSISVFPGLNDFVQNSIVSLYGVD